MKEEYNYPHTTKEIMRCMDTFFWQYSRGWNFLESETKIRNSYGDFIADLTLYYIAKHFKKNKCRSTSSN